MTARVETWFKAFACAAAALLAWLLASGCALSPEGRAAMWQGMMAPHREYSNPFAGTGAGTGSVIGGGTLGTAPGSSPFNPFYVAPVATPW